MDIRFCDLCNESVPDADIAQGRAVLRSGRLICAACEHAMRGGPAPAGSAPPESTAARSGQGQARRAEVPAAPAAPPAPAAGTERGGGLFLGLVALLFAGGAAAVFLAERGGEREARRSLLAGVEGDLGRLAARVDGLAGDLREEALARSGRIEEDLERKSRDLGERVARLAARVDEQGQRAAASAARIEAVERAIEEDSRAAADRRERLAADLALLRRDIEALAERVAALESAPPAGPAAGGAAATGDGARQGEPFWTPLLSGLEDEDAGARWNAVTMLGESGDPAVVPHLLPMLADEDVFVRMAAARVLGDLGSPHAIAGLIDALEDAEAAVRDAAITSLRVLTGEDHGFDPLASPAARAKRVSAWRKWWAKAKDELLAGS